MGTGMQLENLLVSELFPRDDARPLNPNTVKEIAASLPELGQLQPIIVRKYQGKRGYEIIAGNHRVEAFRLAQKNHIFAHIVMKGDLVAEMMMIDENLARADLSPAMRAMYTGRRKEIYEQMHPETGHGKAKPKAKEPEEEESVGVPTLSKSTPESKKPDAFHKKEAEGKKRSSTSVREDIARSNKLGAEILQKISGTCLDTGEQMDALGKMTPEARDKVIERVLDGEKLNAKAELKKQTRGERLETLSKKQKALPDKRYGIILADPEWQFRVRSEKGMDRSAENHYPTSTTEDIMNRRVMDIAAPDCILFLWATAPMMDYALDVMDAWGFSYKAQAVWVKDRPGTGYWFRGMHELLLVGTRGNPVPPAPGTQSTSVFTSKKGVHSAKPVEVMDEIDRLFPGLAKIELNAREARSGWDSWGLEAPDNEEKTDGET